MKKYSKGDFDYIKFDTDEEIEDFVKTVSLLFFVDKDGTLYCFDYYQRRSVRFDKNSYKWVMDSKCDLDDFEGFDEVDEETAKALFKSIPPFECFGEMEVLAEQETLKYYEKVRKETPRKVVGWLSRVSDYIEADDNQVFYSAAIINDIIEHNYFFVADWMNLIPVFDDGTYLCLSSRSMGYLIAISKNEAKDFSYVRYAFGQEFWDEDDSFFNIPKEGLYEK